MKSKIVSFCWEPFCVNAGIIFVSQPHPLGADWKYFQNPDVWIWNPFLGDDAYIDFFDSKPLEFQFPDHA